MQRHGLVGHLAVRYFILCLAALIAFGWWAARSFDTALTQSTWTELEAAANLAATELAPLLADQNLPVAAGDSVPSTNSNIAVADVVARIAQNTRTRIRVVLPDGHVLFDRREDRKSR
jgi:hypothetical protein